MYLKIYLAILLALRNCSYTAQYEVYKIISTAETMSLINNRVYITPRNLRQNDFKMEEETRWEDSPFDSLSNKWGFRHICA